MLKEAMTTPVYSGMGRDAQSAENVSRTV